jgi:glycosyltransferase involved in cell wall biosynthesis
MVRLGIVVPCYNEEEALPRTAKVLHDLLADLITKERISSDSRVYFVDDGSTDGTWEMIHHLASKDTRIAGIKLSSNVGHQSALLAGLMRAEGDVLISMDADLQDDVGVVDLMLAEFANGREIVYGARKRRDTDSTWKRATAQVFYRLLGLLGARVVFNHADYRLMSRTAVEALRGFKEVNLFLRGLIPLLGFSSSVIYYERARRTAGETKYSLRRMMALAVDGVTSFSIVPLRFIFFIGFLVFFFSAMMSLWVLFAAIFNDMTVPGWASTTLPIYFLGGVQILSIGVIGEYTGKIYREVKGRPRYIVERCVGGAAERNEPSIDAAAYDRLKISRAQ